MHVHIYSSIGQSQWVLPGDPLYSVVSIAHRAQLKNINSSDRQRGRVHKKLEKYVLLPNPRLDPSNPVWSFSRKDKNTDMVFGILEPILGHFLPLLRLKKAAWFFHYKC